MTYALIIHGGAGAMPGTDYSLQIQHMGELIRKGQAMLESGNSALNVVEAMVGEQKVAVIVEHDVPNQGDEVFLDFKTEQTRLYADGWLATNAKGAA